MSLSAGFNFTLRAALAKYCNNSEIQTSSYTNAFEAATFL